MRIDDTKLNLFSVKLFRLSRLTFIFKAFFVFSGRPTRPIDCC